MGTTARSAIRQSMAAALGLYASGTATANGTTTTLIDTTRRKEPDDYWNFSQLLKTGGTGSGELGDVSDFTQSSSTITHLQTLTGTDNTTTYDLYKPPFKTADYANAITAALDEAFAKGFGRRGWDETLMMTRQHRYSLPTTVEDLAEVLVQEDGTELLTDNAWQYSGSGWTIHSVGSFTNDGTNQERTLKHTITGAGQYSSFDAVVSPLREYSFRANVKTDGAADARWRYQFINTAGSLVGSATAFGNTTSATWGLITGTFIVPSNCDRVRITFGSTSANGSIYTHAHSLMEQGRFLQWPHSDWDVVWSGTTGYLEFTDRVPSVYRRLLLRGPRTLEVLSADTDTVSFDAPELRAFVHLACATIWEQSMGRLPNWTADQIRANIGLWRTSYGRVANALFRNWHEGRTVATPSM